MVGLSAKLRFLVTFFAVMTSIIFNLRNISDFEIQFVRAKFAI